MSDGPNDRSKVIPLEDHRHDSSDDEDAASILIASMREILNALADDHREIHGRHQSAGTSSAKAVATSEICTEQLPDLDDATGYLEWLEDFLKKPSFTRHEAYTAVFAAFYICDTPAFFFRHFWELERSEGQLKAIERYQRYRGVLQHGRRSSAGRKSGQSRSAARQADLETAARAFNELRQQNDVKTYNLRDIADYLNDTGKTPALQVKGGWLKRLQDLRKAEIKRRADQLH